MEQTRTIALSLFSATMLAASCTQGPMDDRGDARPAGNVGSPVRQHDTSPDTALPATRNSDADSPAADRASRSVDSRTAPGADGVLPLQPGVYVATGSACASPANAGLRFYDGIGISGTATHDCRTHVVSRHGDRFEVEQSCIDVPAGPGARNSESQTVTVHGTDNFTLATADESTRFDHCPPDELPDHLRQRAAQ